MRSKQYKTVAKKVNRKVVLPITEAVDLIKKSSYSKFKGSLELKVNLNVDPKDSEQNVRFVTELPFPTGKTKKVLVISDKKITEKFNTLQVISGGEEIIKKVEEGKLTPQKDFTSVVTEPKYMPNIAKVARILGPKGLMPSPKTGTVGDVEKILKGLDKGQIEIRLQPGNKVVHLTLGTTDSKTEEIAANYKKVIIELKKNKPSKVKKELIISAFLSATMSPAVRVEID